MSAQVKGTSRRQFLQTAALAGAGAAALGIPGAGAALAAAPPAMPTRPYGKTGVTVPILSLGGMFDIITNQAVLHQALRLGVTYWDTAESYNGGRSESGIGAFFGQNPDARKKVFLVSKGYTRDVAKLEHMFQESLRLMQTDFIDMYFVHSLQKNFQEVTPDLIKWGEDKKAKGKIKLFGFSAHRNMEEMLEDAAKADWVDGIMMSYNYRLMHSSRMNDAVEACTEKGIGLTAMKTMGGGPVSADSEAERQLAGRFLGQGYTPEQAKLKAVWEDKRIATICSQMPNVAILMANAAAAMDKTKLSRADHEALFQYAQATACDYCAGCAGICEPAAGGAPIADTLRSLMYSRHYQDGVSAPLMLAHSVPTDLGAWAAADYQAAEAACPRSLPIARLMAQAAQELA